MIKLEEVSSYEVLGIGNQLGAVSSDFTKLCEKEKVCNVQDIVDLLASYPGLNEENIIGFMIEEIEKCLVRANRRGKRPITYEYYRYKDESLKDVDSLNLVETLMLDSPSSCFYSYKSLKKLTIEQLKTNLKLCNRYGNNEILSFPGFGINTMLTIIRALDLYSKQIEENSKQTDKRDINLLLLDYSEKRNLVEMYYEAIIDYFMYIDETIWGKVTDDQKNNLFLSKESNLKRYKDTRERMIQYMTYYLTIDELNEIKHDNLSPLRKFVI